MSAIATVYSNIDGSRRRIAAALAVGVLAALGTAAPSAQGPQRESATSRTPYQAYLTADCLDGSNFCKFVSEEVPASGLLEIQRVACQGWHVSTALPSFVVMAELRTAADAYVKRIDFLKTSYAPTGWGNSWAIGEQTLMFIPAAHKLRISLNSGTIGVGSYGCTISGYLTVP